MNKLRILFLLPVFSIGGGSTLVNNLLKSFVEREEVESITIVSFEEFVKSNNIKYHFSPKINLITIKDNLSDYEKIIKKIEKRCNICYNFWPHFTKLLNVKLPYVITIQDLTVIEFPELSSSGKIFKKWKDTTLDFINRSDVICVSSNTTKNKLFHLFNCSKDVKVIKHAIHSKIAIKNFQNRNKYNEITKKDYFLCLSNTSFHKNLDFVLKAYANSKFSNKYNLVFTGYGTEVFSKNYKIEENYIWSDSYLYGLAKRLNLEFGKQIFGLGFIPIEDKYYLISKAKAVLMPSLAEGGGSYPIEEALHFGIPVITSDIPIIKEAMKDHTAKVLWSNPYSIDSLNNSIEKLYNNYSYYKDQALKDKRTDNNSWENIADQYINAFYRAIEIWEKKDIQIGKFKYLSKEEEVENRTLIQSIIHNIKKFFLNILPYGIVKVYHKAKHNFKLKNHE